MKLVVYFIQAPQPVLKDLQVKRINTAVLIQTDLYLGVCFGRWERQTRLLCLSCGTTLLKTANE
jgi:hypothetical protein